MAFRSLMTAAALVLALVLPAAAQSSFTVTGKIERIDREGHVYLSGQRIRVDADSEVLDQTYRSVSHRELVAGLEVEIDAEETPSGTYARRVLATMMR